MLATATAQASIFFYLWFGYAAAPIVDEVPDGYVFWSFEADYRSDPGPNNYYKVYHLDDPYGTGQFVAIPCHEW